MPVPNAIVTSLAYNSAIDLTEKGVVGLYARHSFRANSAYDPNFTSGSLFDKQPYGWDQLSTLYNKYLVLGSKITCTFVPLGTGTEAPPENAYVFGITTSGLPVGDGGFFLTLQDQPKTHWKYQGITTGTTEQRGYPTLTNSMLTKNFASRGAWTDYQADHTSNPSATIHYSVWLARTGDVAPAMGLERTFRVYVRIVYKVKMWDPEKFPTSLINTGPQLTPP